MTTTALATLSIQKEPLYSELRICAQTCVDKGNNNSDLEGHLECGDSKILDSCFCREDLRPKASTFLSSCVISRCGYNNNDVTSVLKLYNGYCSFKTTSSSSVPAKTTSSSKSTATTSSTKSTANTLTVPTLPSQTKTPTTSEPEPSELSESSTFITTSTSSSSSETPLLPVTTSSYDPSITGSTPPISAGAIAGIVIGSIIALTLGLALLLWIRLKSQRARSEADHDGNEAHRPWKVLDDSENTPPVQNSVDLSPIHVMTELEEAKAKDHDRAAAVEICETGFRAELSAGDDVAWRKGDM
ncbi:hypothetical protein OQA88_5519 [Cercophora sp. LCS_1]